MKKNKNYLILFLIIFGILFFNITNANPIPPGGFPGSTHTYSIGNFIFLWVLMGLLLEPFFAFILFFRKNIKDALVVLFANAISYPLFFLYVAFLSGTILKYILIDFLGLKFLDNYSDLYFLIFIIIGEILVILLEAFIINSKVKQKMTFKKSLLISLVLNMISLAGGFLAPLLITTFNF
jgi:hypothetical protein